MFYLIIFIVELILLFFFSKKLIHSLSLLLYKITNNHSAVVHSLAVIFLPGTIVHELAHLLTAGLMMVPVGELSVVPQIEEHGVKLGSVQIGKTDPIRMTLIGVAPILIGLLLIFCLLFFAQTWENLAWWQIGLGLYLIFEISNTMFSSRKDIEGTVGFLVAVSIVFLLAIFALYFWKPEITQNIGMYLNKQNWTPIVDFFKLGSFSLLIPLGLDLLIIFLATPFLKRR